MHSLQGIVVENSDVHVITSNDNPRFSSNEFCCTDREISNLNWSFTKKIVKVVPRKSSIAVMFQNSICVRYHYTDPLAATAQKDAGPQISLYHF